MLQYSDKVYEENYIKYNDFKYIQRDEPTYCQKCHIEKAERMHHDFMTDTCIARFDHRCAWMQCVIGLYNYPYFFKFCIYSGLFSLFGIINSIIAYCLKLFATQYTSYYQQLVFIICLIFQAVGIFGIIIVAQHIPNIAHNRTTLEIISENRFNQIPKQYDSGNIWENYNQILGNYWYLKILIPFAIMKPKENQNIMLIRRVIFQDEVQNKEKQELETVSKQQ